MPLDGDLITPVPGGLDRYRPHMKYLLIDEVRYEDAELAAQRNLAAALFRFEKSRNLQNCLSIPLLWLTHICQLPLHNQTPKPAMADVDQILCMDNQCFIDSSTTNLGLAEMVWHLPNSLVNLT